MKKQHLIGLTLGAIALLLLFLVLRDRQAPGTSLPPGRDVLGRSLSPAEIQRIVLRKTEEGKPTEIVLLRGEEAWIVRAAGAEAPADSSWIDQLLESLKELDEGGELRARSAEVHDTFVVSDESGVHLVLENASGEELHHLVVGKPNSDWTGTFVRRAGEPEVYLVRTALRQNLRLRGTAESARIEPAAWWKLRLFDVEANDITHLEVAGEEAVDRRLRMEELDEREKPTEEASSGGDSEESAEPGPLPTPPPSWTVVEGKELEDPGSLIRSFATARATRVAAEGAETGLEEGPSATLRAWTRDGSVLVLEVGDSVADNEGARYVRRAGEDTVYVLPAYAVGNLLRAGEED